MRLLRVIVCLLLAAACSTSDPASSAERAAVGHIERTFSGQYGPLWDELLPAHQQIVGRDVFVSCAARVMGVALHSVDVEIVDSYRERVTPPETDEPLSSVAVTMELDGDAAVTMHEVVVDGQWRWYLAQPSAFDDC